jgi:iron complex transport system substrate-binding protein
LHAGYVPVFARLRQSLLLTGAALLLAAAPAAAQGVGQGAPPARVISLNMCTDQLLLDLAQPAQIAGLSPFAADAARSFLADRARALPILSGTAEEVMVLKPDLVVSGTFTKRATREFIRARGVPLEEFAPVRTLAESKRQITRFGEITGARAAAAARNAELDAGLAELRAAAAARKLRVLPLARRAWVAGSQSLMSELLTEAGLVNAAGELGIRTGGRVTLEQIVMLKPDAILLSRDDDMAEDQGRALLLHPAIQALFPPERRIIIPERLTVCGGPMLAEAMRALAGQISRLQPRWQTAMDASR